jgi:hypothetical protein
MIFIKQQTNFHTWDLSCSRSQVSKEFSLLGSDTTQFYTQAPTFQIYTEDGDSRILRNCWYPSIKAYAVTSQKNIMSIFSHLQICETTQNPKNMDISLTYDDSLTTANTLFTRNPCQILTCWKHSFYELHLRMFTISWIMFIIQHPVWLQNILLQFSDYIIPWKLHEVFFSSRVNVKIVSDVSEIVCFDVKNFIIHTLYLYRVSWRVL